MRPPARRPEFRAAGQSMAERGSADRLRQRPPRAIWTERFARCDGDRRRDAGADEPAAEGGEQDAFELRRRKFRSAYLGPR